MISTKNIPIEIVNNIVSPYRALADSVENRVRDVKISSDLNLDAIARISDKELKPYFRWFAQDTIDNLIYEHPSVLPSTIRRREENLKNQFDLERNEYKQTISTLKNKLAKARKNYTAQADSLNNVIAHKQNMLYGTEGLLGLFVLGAIANKIRNKIKRK